MRRATNYALIECFRSLLSSTRLAGCEYHAMLLLLPSNLSAEPAFIEAISVAHSNQRLFFPTQWTHFQPMKAQQLLPLDT